jgi:hypothetical protein
MNSEKDKKPEKRPGIKEIPPREMPPREGPQTKEILKAYDPTPPRTKMEPYQTFGIKPPTSTVTPYSESGSQFDHAGSSRKVDDVPTRNVYKPPERAPVGPDPARISIRNSLRETLFAR